MKYTAAAAVHSVCYAAAWLFFSVSPYLSGNLPQVVDS